MITTGDSKPIITLSACRCAGGVELHALSPDQDTRLPSRRKKDTRYSKLQYDHVTISAGIRNVLHMPRWVSVQFSVQCEWCKCCLSSAATGLSPEFLGSISNMTISQGRDATFACSVRNLGGYKVNTALCPVGSTMRKRTLHNVVVHKMTIL